MKLILIMASALLVAGCAALDTRNPFAYAYDEGAIDTLEAATLTTDFPRTLIEKVDERSFSISAFKGHPAKIYALPGLRVIKIRVQRPGAQVLAGNIFISFETVTVSADLKAGSTYYIDRNGVKFVSR